jgi:hypothetical protein
MSSTGSSLGVFRLDRDVISCQPDLVLIEFAVNDGGGSDAEVVRNLETIVVRLKSLPHPPAIVFLEAAAKYKSNRTRHQLVSGHYGLLDIDLQESLDNHLARTGEEWSALMGDDVHPNDQGHAFYAAVIEERLRPFIEKAKTWRGVPPKRLPKRLSKLPLLLDARMAPVPISEGWGTETSIPFWWSRFFNGFATSSVPGAALEIPIRGTTFGLFLPLLESYGTFYVSVDGQNQNVVQGNSRSGFISPILATDLPAQEHILRIVVAKPVPGSEARPVKLGYILIAGETAATGKLAPQGPYTVERFRNLSFLPPIAAENWMFIGPFGGSEPTFNVTGDLKTVFPPEVKVDLAQSYTGHAGKPVSWVRLSGSDATIDFGKLTGLNDRGVSYAAARVWLEQAQTRYAWLVIDYFGKVWVNGKQVLYSGGVHGGPKDPIVFPVDLQRGWNDILVKVHSGSNGNSFSLSLEQPSGDFHWANPNDKQ